MVARNLPLLALAVVLTGCLGRRDWLDTGHWSDSDGDGYGDGQDCDPTDPGVHPGAGEYCNGVDDDCDGLVDDEDENVIGSTSWSMDGDGDGFGGEADAVVACEQPEGMVAGSSDCDDSDPQVNPGADEVCDGVDNDCDGEADNQSVDATEWHYDEDGDGWGVDEWSHWDCEQPTDFVDVGGDCDDEDAEINPDANELCDGEDNDCDGETDEDVVGVFYRDRDEDGYGDPDVYVEQCPAPSGYVADNTDCDDGDGGIHPDATEYCDGEDHDCDGASMEGDSIDAEDWYPDADGDGYGDSSALVTACEQPSGHVEDGADCDDANDAVNPDAYDYCDDYADGVDDDCDGTPDNPDAAYEFHEDADGDGYGDAAVAATGCSPPEGMTTDASDCDDTVGDAHPGGIERYGWGIDYDCDGDLIHTVDDAQAALLGESSGDEAGDALLALGDYDGDGAYDLVIGACNEDAGGSGAGAVYVLLGSAGPPSGSQDLSSASVKLTGMAAGDLAGQALALLGDVDGDGLDDLGVGAPGNDDAHSGAGAAFLVTGATISSGTKTFDLSYADGSIFGESASDAAGSYLAAAGDTDDDGLDDLWVSAPSYDGSAGAVYLVQSPASGEVDLCLASALLEGEASSDAAGPVAGGGDVDGDGQPDVLVGAPKNDEAGTNAGRAYLFLGPVSGTASLGDADTILEGEDSQAYAGSSVGYVGDGDGDGLDDVFVASPGGTTGGWTTGSAYLVGGGTLSDYVGSAISLAGADASFEGEAAADNAGWFIAAGGDLDGDGASDFLVGAPAEDATASDAGALYLVLGPVSGTEDLATSWIKIGSEQAGDALGSTASFAGDLDGDGLDDLLLGAPGDGTTASDAGAALLFLAGDL